MPKLGGRLIDKVTNNLTQLGDLVGDISEINALAIVNPNVASTNVAI